MIAMLAKGGSRVEVTVAGRAVRSPQQTEGYLHDEQAVLRPDVGTQAQFKKRKPPRRYKYDDSLSPALEWDGQNSAREIGEWLIAQIEESSRLGPPHRFPKPRRFGDIVVDGLEDALACLRALSGPFLNWAGKAERTSFDVPTLPLFVHERLSTKAVLETLKAHERDRQMELQLFGDPQLSLAQQLEAYEHTGGWVNRLILGDSLVVMNSLLEYESLGGQVQMIFIDPPYGVRFGSNFQPFIRKRDVRDGSDDDMTREPEMVRAYRDTWQLGPHSYLTYLRDRLALSRELLLPSGSIFVQIGSENVHHVRELLDECFGSENFIAQIAFVKTGGSTHQYLAGVSDYLLFYAKDRDRLKYREVFREKSHSSGETGPYSWLEFPDGTRRRMRHAEREDPATIPPQARRYRLDNLQSQSMGRAKGEGAASWFPVELDGKTWLPSQRSRWKTNESGMERLKAARRLQATATGLYYVRYFDDFPATAISDVWDDTVIAGFTSQKSYVVETSTKVVQRCILMATDPGDLVIDPTCGSGTTAYVAEQWGRRWITIDTSRVPLALARQRLLTGTFPYYELRSPERDPSSGFIYRRKKNAKGEEIGGIVPHVTLRSIATAEPAQEEVLVDRPEVNNRITRVTGPFCVEATIPTPEGNGDGGYSWDEDDYSFADRLLEVLRRNPVLRLGANRTITLHEIRPPAKSLILSAEAVLHPSSAPIALVFGPENGAVNEKLVYEAAREGHARNYEQLIVIGFAIEAAAREFIDKCENLVGLPASYVQVTPDLIMGDLLKTMRSSQIFSVTGLPDVRITRKSSEEQGGPDQYQVELLGLDVFDPISMQVDHHSGADVPAWFLDTDYNDLCFLVSQAFFPRTSAWENLRKSLKGEFEDSVWQHLAGTTSTLFRAGEHRKVAVKVIDDRGNEMLVVKSLDTVE